MKITIAYLPAEETEAAAVMAAICSAAISVRVHKSDNHPPFKHIYLTTRKTENH